MKRPSRESIEKFLRIDRSAFSHDTFDNTDEYYERAAESQVNNGFHEFARHVATSGLWVRQGRLRIIIPRSVRDLHGTPSVIAGVHRSRSDIPHYVRATEKAGFHSTRPLAKDSYFSEKIIEEAAASDPKEPAVVTYIKKKVVSWAFQSWGAVGVDRDNPNIDGINKFGAGALKNGYSVKVFTEGTRIKTRRKDGSLTGFNTRVVEEPRRTAAFLSIQNQAPLIPFAVAGVADNDTTYPLWFGDPVVAVFGEPIIPELWTPEQDRAELALLRGSRIMSKALHFAQQDALDLAYLIREA